MNESMLIGAGVTLALTGQSVLCWVMYQAGVGRGFSRAQAQAIAHMQSPLVSAAVTVSTLLPDDFTEVLNATIRNSLRGRSATVDRSRQEGRAGQGGAANAETPESGQIAAGGGRTGSEGPEGHGHERGRENPSEALSGQASTQG